MIPSSEKLKGQRVHAGGLEVARSFFDEWGLPYLRAEFPEVSERAACFLYGGSQSLGNDDLLSCDHGWGPQFTIVLLERDYDLLGPNLHESINKAAPKEWNGRLWRSAPEPNIPVMSMNQWFRENIQLVQPPETLESWIKDVREHNLYELRHATIFHDPLGEFTARRKQFWYYPRNAWLHRLATEVWDAWHFGQYNFLDRLAKRDDPIAVAICIGRFVTASMKLCMLLREDYTPYWKWLATEFRKLDGIEEMDSWLSELSVSNDKVRQVELVDTVCKDLYRRLLERNLVSPKPTGHPHPLKCADTELRERRDKAS